MAITMGFSTMAGAAPKPSEILHIKSGGVWTLVMIGTGCQGHTFAKGHTFTADDFDNAGIYTGGGRIINEKWTAGSDTGLTFKGTWSNATSRYSGRLGGIVKGEHQKAILTSGAGDACGG
jgi:hypothetical protein